MEFSILFFAERQHEKQVLVPPLLLRAQHKSEQPARLQRSSTTYPYLIICENLLSCRVQRQVLFHHVMNLKKAK
jgi:hypothetical protein